MDRNIIIALLSSIIIPWGIYVIKARKSLEAGVVMTGYAMLASWVVMIGLPNIPFLLSPLTPPIHGSVIEGRTNQPVADCNIKAYWEIETISIAGGHWESYQQFETKTNAQGEFIIPRRLKTLTVLGFLPALEVVSHHNGIRVLAYAHGYSYDEKKIERQKLGITWKASDMLIKVYPPSDTYLREVISSLESKFESWNIPNRILTDEDVKFLREDYRVNFGLFTSMTKNEKSKENKSTLIDFASSLQRSGDYKTAIKALEKIKNDYPESAQFAAQEIETLRRNVK